MSVNMRKVLESSDDTNQLTDLGLATFFIGNTCYGIDILVVQEIGSLSAVTPVPLTPVYVKGVVNLRGQIVTIIDLAMRVGTSSESDSGSGNIIIVAHENEFVGLQVDSIGDVLSTSRDQVESPPANLNSIHRNYINGVLKIQDRLVEILDLGAVLKIE